jgi:hypothetical protein
MATEVKATLAAALAALLIASVAHAAEVLEHPQDVLRTDVVGVEWAAPGGSPAPQVVVEYRHGLFWITETSAETGDVLVADEGEDVWSARWQPGYDSPAGIHRIRVEGEGYGLTTDPFRVLPCECVMPNRVRAKWRHGRYRLRVSAAYAPVSARGFLALPTQVTTGQTLVRVLRDGHRVGSVLLRYRQGKFRGSWRAPRVPRNSLVFQLVTLKDAFGNG